MLFYVSNYLQLFRPQRRPPPAGNRPDPGLIPNVHYQPVEDDWVMLYQAGALEGIEIAGRRQSEKDLDGSPVPRQLTGSQRIPHGSTHYSFQPVVPPQLPPLTTATEKETLQVRDEITAKFDEIGARRTAIHTSLKAFKACLGVTEDADLPACFKIIKDTAGLGSQVEVQDTELTMDEDSWSEFPEEYQKAVQHFNTMLQRCHQFLDEKQSVIRYIEMRLRILQNPSHIQTRAIKETYNVLKDIPKQIEEFSNEIDRLVHDIHVAKKYLATNEGITGLMSVED